MIALSQRCSKHGEIRATYQSESLHHFDDSVAWNPRNAPASGVLMEQLWSRGPRFLEPRRPSNPSVMHCLDRSMMIDWSTGRILEGGPFRNLSFAQTLHPLRRFTGPSWVLISGLGGVEGHFVIVRRLGRACDSRSFSCKNCGPVHHNIYVSVGISSDCIST